MKNIIRSMIISGLLAAGVVQSHAVVTKHTYVQAVGFTLSAFKDGTAAPVKITSKDIIASLNGLTGSGSNVLAFTKNAKLLLKTDLANTNGPTQTIVVRDGRPAVDTDVSAFFAFGESDSVSTTTGARTVKHSLASLAVRGNTITLDLSGFETSARAAIGGVTITTAAGADLSGAGEVGAVHVIAHGTVSLGTGHLEAP